MQTRKKKCIIEKCDKYSMDSVNKSNDISKIMKPFLDKQLKRSEDRILNKSLTDEELKDAKIILKNVKKAHKQFHKSSMNKLTNDKKIFNDAMKTCKLLYCNPGCKNTIFEDGFELPKSILNKWKKNKPFLSYLKKTRKERFGNKTSVLVDDFFKDIDPKIISKYKKEGAISGCYEPL